jgi:GAF domain-containing protein
LTRGLESSILEQSVSAQALAEERNLLEQHVQERTRDLERRLIQIRTAADISRSISGLMDTERLLHEVVTLVKERFDLYYAGVFLIDERGEYAVLRAGTGEAGASMTAEGHKLAIGGTSMIGWTCANRLARIALDVGQDAVHFENPYLPDTHSELALPLISGNRVLGAITVQSSEPQAFDENDITVLQGIGDSLATAIENAKLFRQVEVNLQEIRTLHRQYLSEAWNKETQLDDLTYDYKNEAADEDGDTQTYEIPLELRDQVIGRLVLETGRRIEPEEMSIAREAATEATIALENARLLGEIRKRSQQESVIGQITSKIQSSLHLETVMRTALAELGLLVNASRLQIRLGEPEQSSTAGTNGGLETRS